MYVFIYKHLYINIEFLPMNCVSKCKWLNKKKIEI